MTLVALLLSRCVVLFGRGASIEFGVSACGECVSRPSVLVLIIAGCL